MKQTVNINLGGIVFHIDNDAYATLETYINKINRNLQSDSKDEIMQDIEARIAELFQQHLQYSKMEVVNLRMVNDIMLQLGSPEAIGAESEDETMDSQDSSHSDDAQEVEAEEISSSPVNEKQTAKKLYRDVDHQVIAGVCAGLGERIGLDATLIRIIFVLLVVLQGAGLLAYLVLWIIMPAADSAARRLEMRGIDPSAENIQKEVERTQEERNANPNKGHRSTAGNLMFGCLITFGILLGLPLLFVIFILVTVFGSVAFAGASVMGSLLNLPLATGLSFGSLCAICSVLVILIPLIVLIIWLVNRKMGKAFWITAIVLWMLSLIGATSSMYKTFTSFSDNHEQWEQIKSTIEQLSENEEAMDAFEQAMQSWGEQMNTIMEENAYADGVTDDAAEEVTESATDDVTDDANMVISASDNETTTE